VTTRLHLLSVTNKPNLMVVPLPLASSYRLITT
jgi:hypothetical protein